MSLILDALRKSEAERRRGQSPDLFAASPGVPAAPPARPRVWPLLVLGAMLLASAWLIWSSGGDARPPAVIEPADADLENVTGFPVLLELSFTADTKVRRRC